MSNQNENLSKKGENSVLNSRLEPVVPEYEIEEVIDECKKNPKLKDLSEEQLKEIAQISIIVVRQESMFAGPLPHPAILKRYEKTLPGAADRVLKMNEANATNRHILNDKIVNADNKRSGRGQILGFILSILFIGAAIFVHI